MKTDKEIMDEFEKVSESKLERISCLYLMLEARQSEREKWKIREEKIMRLLESERKISRRARDELYRLYEQTLWKGKKNIWDDDEHGIPKHLFECKPTSDAICGDEMCPYVPCSEFPDCRHMGVEKPKKKGMK